MYSRISRDIIGLAFVLLLFSWPAHAQDSLKFFKNYFITGDYQVAGVGLSGTGVNGIANGDIRFSAAKANEVPHDAEVLAAYLYFQVVTKTSTGPDAVLAAAKFDDVPLSVPGGLIAKVLDQAGTAPCWSSGGATGDSSGAHRTYTYRADVLRFMPVGDDPAKPRYGQHLINDADLIANGRPFHSIELPDSGNGNGEPNALGASLVVIYRDADPTAQLNAVVLYDGGFAMNNSVDLMSVSIKGFYDPKPISGKLTHIVGSGQANKSERLLVGGVLVATNPFQSTAGPGWDNFTVNTAAAADSVLTTTVDRAGISSFDCLTWGAVVYRTPVRDTDNDGLLDLWESSLGPISDPDGILGIAVHFDVGSGYPFGAADPYVIRGVGLTRGGDAVNETATLCTSGPLDPPWVCQFSAYPGTVGWKSGFRFLKDAPLSLTDDQCEAAEGDHSLLTACERRFDRNRKDIFRYALFAHALGVPKASCLVQDPANPEFGLPDEVCMDTVAEYHTPVSNTGVGDFLGGDLMVTLGAFPNTAGLPVGSTFTQASTLTHEIGHTLARRHNGSLIEPNCSPNYLSVMNYLFQLRGLVDDAGVAHIDFSGQRFPALNEGLLNEPGLLGYDLDPPFGLPSYRSAWYAPRLPGTLGVLLDLPAAKRHCDGSPLTAAEEADRLAGGGFVRLDETSAGSSIDWRGDGAPSTSALTQDVNFDGVIGSLPGSNDWSQLRLNGLGSRRSVGGWYLVPDPSSSGEFLAYIGPLSLDAGRGDLGRGDLGRGDLGRGDLGRGDLGRGDLGRGDLGRGDLGRGDLGRGDLGRGDLGRGDLGRGDLGRGDLGGGDDISAEVASANGYSPPNELKGVVLQANCDGSAPADCHRNRLDWKSPNVGSAAVYTVGRVKGTAIDPDSLVSAVGETAAVIGQDAYALTDHEELPNGPFTYFVRASFGDGTRSGLSNLATVQAVNAAPVAFPESYTVVQDSTLNVPALGVLANDTDIDSSTLKAGLVSGPAHGTLTLNLNGSFTYTPATGYYGPDSFSYVASDVDPTRSSNQATVSITVIPLYGFTPVKNLPPSKSVKPGTVIGLSWRFTIAGIVVDSNDAVPQVSISGPGGTFFYAPEAPLSGSFVLPTSKNGWTWTFNWKAVNATGANLTPGSYAVTIESRKTTQTFSGGTIDVK